MMVAASESQQVAVIKDLVAFVHRVTTDKNATPAEVAALPGIARVIFDQYQRH